MVKGGCSKKVMTYQYDEVRKICALVVDGDPLVRRVHGMMLARYGLEIQAAENGKEAVDLFLFGKNFDLVIMDMDMPVMDGPKATQMLREMGVSCMIVGVTAQNEEAEKEAFMEAGLDFCWEKPLDARTVISILDELAKKLL